MAFETSFGFEARDRFSILPTWLTISGHLVCGAWAFLGAFKVVVRGDYKLVGATLPKLSSSSESFGPASGDYL